MKKKFTPFEKSVLEIISETTILESLLLGSIKYEEKVLFLSSPIFQNNQKEWEKEGIINSKCAVKAAFQEYLENKQKKVDLLTKYYVVGSEKEKESWIVVNAFTKEMYHVLKTVDGLTTAGYSFIPLMVKFDKEMFDDIPIEEYPEF